MKQVNIYFTKQSNLEDTVFYNVIRVIVQGGFIEVRQVYFNGEIGVTTWPLDNVENVDIV